MGLALNKALDWLARWGAPGRLRDDAAEPITDAALAIDIYEGERPPADQAFRLGDARFLNMGNVTTPMPTAQAAPQGGVAQPWGGPAAGRT